MTIELEPGNGIDNDTPRLWAALAQAKAMQSDVLLRPGKYVVDNTLTVDGTFLHGPLVHDTARRDNNDGFPWICPRFSSSPEYVPVVQLRNNGRLENLLIEWDGWPAEKRNIGVMCAQQFSMRSVKITGANTAIQTGADFANGSQDSSRFLIEDCYLLWSRDRALSLRACMEWATVKDVLVKFCQVGIDMFDSATDVTFQNVQMLAGDSNWQNTHPASPAIDIKAGPNDPSRFCSGTFVDCSFDMFANVLRVAGNELGGGFNRVVFRGGNSLSHNDGVIYDGAGTRLLISGVTWKGNSGSAIKIAPWANSSQITLSGNILEFPNGNGI